jgi:hypothetical protein
LTPRFYLHYTSSTKKNIKEGLLGLFVIEISHLGHVSRCIERCLITHGLPGSPSHKSQTTTNLYPGRFRGWGVDCRIICGVGSPDGVRLAWRNRPVTSRCPNYQFFCVVNRRSYRRYPLCPMVFVCPLNGDSTRNNMQ